MVDSFLEGFNVVLAGFGAEIVEEEVEELGLVGVSDGSVFSVGFEGHHGGLLGV